MEGQLSAPLAYHITFTCYGTRLHGCESGSVDRNHNVWSAPVIEENAPLERSDRSEMTQPPYEMDQPRRKVVLETIKEVCRHRDWDLFALHVRTKHVHVVVSAGVPPEKVMKDFKAYSSRRLTENGFESKDRKRWARHGSTEYLWEPDDLECAVNYVIRRQGEPMEVYEKQ